MESKSTAVAVPPSTSKIEGDKSKQIEPKKPFTWKKIAIIAAAIVALIVIVIAIWSKSRPTGPGVGFVSGNGRLEATEIDVATKLAGPIRDIMVNEGDFVQPGQLLAEMRIDGLIAQRDEARAKYRHDVTAIASAEAKVASLQSDVAAQQAIELQRVSDLKLSQQKLRRVESLSRTGAIAQEEVDIDRAGVQSSEAALAAAKAQVVSAKAAVKAAEADVLGSSASAEATTATIARIEADIEDSHLKAPRGGRIQYRIAQPGEVLAGGGKVLNLVDLNDVYMTFFLPETVVGRVPLGAEVRLILDAAPQYVIPAKISYVSSTAQFTPKTVETVSERQKLMFRVKAQIDLAVLQSHIKMVKTGLPGVVWVKLDANIQWPANLEIKVPE